ncbi:MAG: hypothetical protein FWD17_19420 [Polyangiaceae bacterium]|nr:hypothetical protein [Polyangiaceae bacterium]
MQPTLVDRQPTTHAERIASPDVRRTVAAILHREGMLRHDVEDLTQEVLSRALVVDPPPPTWVQCIGLVKKMARQIAIDAARRRRARGRVDAGPIECPDEHTVDAVVPGAAYAVARIDDRRRIESLRAQIDSGAITARQAAMLAMSAGGASRAEVAAHFGVAEQTVANELAAARRIARHAWSARTGAALFAIAVGVVAAAYFWGPRSRTARPDDSVAAPSATVPPGAPGAWAPPKR